MSRLFDRLERGDLALGVQLLQQGPEWCEIAGEVGLDFCRVDTMFTSLDWESAADMMRAATRYDMTPMIRLQAYPWAGRADGRMLPDIARALSIGAEGVVISLDTPEEIAAAVALARDPHRRVHIYTNYEVQGMDALRQLQDRYERETLIMPLIESAGAVKRIDEILAVKGLRAISLGLGDVTRQGLAGPPGNFEHSETLAFTERIVKRAKQKGIHVFVNAGRQDTPESVANRVQWLRQAGVSGVTLPTFSFVVQRFYEKAVPLARAVR